MRWANARTDIPTDRQSKEIHRAAPQLVELNHPQYEGYIHIYICVCILVVVNVDVYVYSYARVVFVDLVKFAINCQL